MVSCMFACNSYPFGRLVLGGFDLLDTPPVGLVALVVRGVIL